MIHVSTQTYKKKLMTLTGKNGDLSKSIYSQISKNAVAEKETVRACTILENFINSQTSTTVEHTKSKRLMDLPQKNHRIKEYHIRSFPCYKYSD